MMEKGYSSLDRTMAAITHQIPDRVPLFLFLSTYGAKEMNMNPKTYFSRAKNIVDAQLKMKEKYKNDCIYTFFYAPIEVEAFGGEVIFVDDGPPNTGKPFIKDLQEINKMRPPDIYTISCLTRVLEVTRQLKERVDPTTPIIGVVMSPFSLPVMQMGFEKYIDLIYFHQEAFHGLMSINQKFCIAWANAQIEAGASAICYFNPLASPNIIEKKTYLSLGYPIDEETLRKINGKTATHLASGITLPLLHEIVNTGTAVLGFGLEDNIKELKKAASKKICLLGNLNGIEMVHWNKEEVHQKVKNIIQLLGSEGGFILADSHGEIPWQVPEQVLLEISKAIDRHGIYPLEEVLNK